MKKRYALLFFIIPFFIASCANSFSSRMIEPKNQSRVIKENYGVDLIESGSPKRYTEVDFGFQPDTPKTIGEAQAKYPDYSWVVRELSHYVRYPVNKLTDRTLYFRGKDNSKKITYQLATADPVRMIQFKNDLLGGHKFIAIYIPSYDELSYVCMSQGKDDIKNGYFTCNTRLEFKVLKGIQKPH